MEEKSIPYIAHEAALAREERTIKKLWILCIIMFFALVATNAGWIYYESQFKAVKVLHPRLYSATIRKLNDM